MTDAQLLTLALAAIIPISLTGAGIIFSNSRINDAKETLRAEIQGMRTELRADIQAMRNDMLASMGELKGLLQPHELEHHR
jgi:hypothetical protein